MEIAALNSAQCKVIGSSDVDEYGALSVGRYRTPMVIGTLLG